MPVTKTTAEHRPFWDYSDACTFQCPWNGLGILAEYDRDAHTLTLSPDDVCIEEMESDYSYDRGEVVEFCRSIPGTQIDGTNPDRTIIYCPSLTEARRILTAAGVPAVDQF